jgi:signal transduction histidine kinase
MATRAEIMATLDSARSDLERAVAQLHELPSLDWATVRCAAHTLGNFLNITYACVQLLKDALEDHPNAEVHAWLQALERTTDLMTYTARQLTNASAASDVPLLPEKVNLSLMAQRGTTIYESMANNKDLRFVFEKSDSALVWADRIALAAVLDNLLSNGVKYSPPGKEIRVRIQTEPGHVICTVEDQGPGLSPEDQARLFQQGVRLGSTPTGGETSTGFGLFIAKRLIERMGGKIWCETAPGQGCRFSFRLPAFAEKHPRTGHADPEPQQAAQRPG